MAKKSFHVLIVDDEEASRMAMREHLDDVYTCHEVTNGQEAVEYIQNHEVDLVLLDITMPVMDGFEALQRIKNFDPTIEVIMVSSDVSLETGLRARSLGAFSYVTKTSLRVDHLQYLNTIERALEKRERVQEQEVMKTIGNESLGPIIGESAVMKDVKGLISTYALSDITVLIEGPTGVGKELVARAIHGAGPRAGHPFVAVNCSALPESLFAVEMFGCEKGAFTGADQRRKGKFEQAHKGTLFLDEIGTLAMDQQVMLLRAVEDKVIQRLGGEKGIKVDARIIAATDVDLKEAMHQKKFHEPLFYRINGLPIEIPSLRERPEDIATLLDYFLAIFNKKFRKQKRWTLEAREVCLRYPWPGNVREMKALMERVIWIHPGDDILPEHFPLELRRGGTVVPLGRREKESVSEIRIFVGERPLEEVQEEFEKKLIERALERTGGVQIQATKLLHMDPKTLRAKMREYGFLQ